jgi:hypothetical protein
LLVLIHFINMIIRQNKYKKINNITCNSFIFHLFIFYVSMNVLYHIIGEVVK